MSHQIEELYKFFHIKGDERHSNNKWSDSAVIITPNYMSAQIVINEWNYVCSQSPRTHTLIDYDGAIELLKHRNPQWQILITKVAQINFSPRESAVYPKPLPPNLAARSRYVRVTGMHGENKSVMAEYEIDMLLTRDESDRLVERYLARDKLPTLENKQIIYVPKFED